MNRVVKIFMERDGMTKQEAIAHYKEIREDVAEILRQDNGFSGYDEVEDLLLSEGLEMDFAFDFI